jgi:hypothetical protein
MNDPSSSYGLWSMVVINSAVFIFFAFSFFKPRSKRDWRTLGMFSAFIVALFTEMYGFPLTIYLLSGWLARQFPGVDFLGHDSGHLLEVMFGWRSNPHFGPFHLLSTLFIGGGFWLLARAWRVLYAAQASGTAGHRRALRKATPSAISRFHPDHGRLSAAMADADHLDDVPDHDRGLPATGTPRGTRCGSELWRSMGVLRAAHPGLLAALDIRKRRRSSPTLKGEEHP